VTVAETTDNARPVVENGSVGRFLYGAAVVLLVAWVVVPLYLLLVNTLSSPDAVQGFPKTGLPTFDFGSVNFFLTYDGVGQALLNSVLAAVITMVLALVLGAPAGYALSRFDFPGKSAFRLLVLMTRAFPLPLLALPLAVMFIQVHLDDSVIGLALVHTTLALPFSVLVTFSIFSGIPVEFEEAAWTLGCNRWQGFRKVVLPLVLPGIAASGLRLHHLLERGFRGLGADGAEPDADRVPAPEPRLFAAAAEIRRRRHAGPAGADLHLRRAQIPALHVGHRQPIERDPQQGHTHADRNDFG